MKLPDTVSGERLNWRRLAIPSGPRQGADQGLAVVRKVGKAARKRQKRALVAARQSK